MKRIVLCALCMAVLASGAYALDKTFGGGILYNNATTNGSTSNTYDGDPDDWTMTRNGFGGFVFFGVSPFVEFNLGYMYKNPSEITEKYHGQTYTVTGSDIYLEGTGALQFGIYLKYPIPIGSAFVFFPTGGVDFEFSMSSEEYNGWEWWHDLWLRAGIGLDVFFSDSLFLRSHFIYGAAVPVGGSEDLGLQFGHGLLIKIGLGFMF
jgi:hypothetical protein